MPVLIREYLTRIICLVSTFLYCHQLKASSYQSINININQ
jgi:hypothetical protein